MSVQEAERSAQRGTSVRWRSHRSSTLAGVCLLVALGVCGVVLPQLGVNTYVLSVAYTVAFYVAVAQSWNLFSGFTGYISFAQGALVGVGSYAGILAANHGASFIVAIGAGAAAALIASVLVGLPSLRLRGIAFAFATIFFQAIVLIATEKSPSVTNGPQGLASTQLKPISALLVAMTLVAVTATMLVLLLRRSRLGLKLLAIREDETAAGVVGIRTIRLKLTAFAVSALFAGAAGAIHGFFLSTLFPVSVFNIKGSVEPLVIALVGGPASAFGPLVMATVYGVSQEILRSIGSELQLVLLGAILVIVVLFARNGLAGLVSRGLERIRARRTKESS